MTLADIIKGRNWKLIRVGRRVKKGVQEGVRENVVGQFGVDCWRWEQEVLASSGTLGQQHVTELPTRTYSLTIATPFLVIETIPAIDGCHPSICISLSASISLINLASLETPAPTTHTIGILLHLCMRIYLSKRS